MEEKGTVANFIRVERSEPLIKDMTFVDRS